MRPVLVPAGDEALRPQIVEVLRRARIPVVEKVERGIDVAVIDLSRGKRIPPALPVGVAMLGVAFRGDKLGGEADEVVFAEALREELVPRIALLRERLDVMRRRHTVNVETFRGRASKEVVALAGAVAHELNQPLTMVMGYSEMLLRDGAPNQTESAYANTILEEARRMASIIRSLSSVGKFETMPYVGDERILDLQKSVVEED